MSVSEMNPLLEEWVDQEINRAVLNKRLKDSFNDGDLDGIDQALSAGADPNSSMYYSSEPTLFSDEGFSVTFLDIVENSNFFEGEQRNKVREILIRHDACTTDEGKHAFCHWTQRGFILVAPKKRSLHKNCLIEVVFRDNMKELVR